MKSVILNKIGCRSAFFLRENSHVNTIELQFINTKLIAICGAEMVQLPFFPQHFKMFYNTIIFINK